MTAGGRLHPDDAASVAAEPAGLASVSFLEMGIPGGNGGGAPFVTALVCSPMAEGCDLLASETRKLAARWETAPPPASAIAAPAGPGRGRVGRPCLGWTSSSPTRRATQAAEPHAGPAPPPPPPARMRDAPPRALPALLFARLPQTRRPLV